MIFLLISEEYGCQEWYAVLSEDQFGNLKKRWATIKGLNCLVPVNFIIEQAKPLCSHEKFPIKLGEGETFVELQDVDFFMDVISAHIHQSDDSYISTVDYEILEGDEFEMEGISYSSEQVYNLFDQYKEKNNNLFDEIEIFRENYFKPFSERR